MLIWFKKFVQKYHADAIIIIGLILFIEGSLFIYLLKPPDPKTFPQIVTAQTKTSAVQPVQTTNPTISLNLYPDNTEGEFLTMLGILLALLGAVGTGIYLWIQRNVEGDAKELMRGGRLSARAEAHITLAYTLWCLYEKDKKKESLDMAIEKIEIAHKIARDLDPKDYADIICSVKDNLAYYLAEKQSKEKEIDVVDKARAMKIKEELWELIESGNIPQQSGYSIDDYANELKETCAWVMYCFAGEDIAQKQKARYIIRGLKNHFSPQRFAKLKNRYSI